MKLTLILTITLFLAGCEQYESHLEIPIWQPDGTIIVVVEERKYNSVMKNVDLDVLNKTLSSTSQSIGIDVTATPVGVKVKGETI